MHFYFYFLFGKNLCQRFGIITNPLLSLYLKEKEEDPKYILIVVVVVIIIFFLLPYKIHIAKYN